MKPRANPDTADAAIASSLTQEQQIRLESVKLAFRHDRDAPTIVDKASALAAFIAEGTVTSPEQGKLAQS